MKCSTNAPKRVGDIDPRSDIMRRRLDQNVVDKRLDDNKVRYHDFEYFAIMAHAFSGGIESSLQFMLQVSSHSMRLL